MPGFHVDGFGSAFWGAIFIGIISWMLSAFFRGSDGRVHVLTHHTQIRQVRGRAVSSKEGERLMMYLPWDALPEWRSISFRFPNQRWNGQHHHA